MNSKHLSLLCLWLKWTIFQKHETEEKNKGWEQVARAVRCVNGSEEHFVPTGEGKMWLWLRDNDAVSQWLPRFKNLPLRMKIKLKHLKKIAKHHSFSKTGLIFRTGLLISYTQEIRNISIRTHRDLQMSHLWQKQHQNWVIHERSWEDAWRLCVCVYWD